MRVGYITDVQFFQDSQTTTKVHWYLVPKDRPALPVASFVDDADWYNFNGPRSPLFKGMPPGMQGEQWADRPFDKKKPPDPSERYTGHYCGNPEQWAGKLSFDNPKDHGRYGCCLPADEVGEVCGCVSLSGTAASGRRDIGSLCECVSLAGSASFDSFPVGVVCGCDSLAGTGVGGVRADGTLCSCAALGGTEAGDSFPSGPVCGCVSLGGTGTLIHTAAGALCGCVSLSGTATGPIPGSSCGCVSLSGTAAFEAFPAGPLCECVALGGSGGLTPVVTFTCGDITPLGGSQSTAALIITDNAYIRNGAGNNLGVRLPAGCNRIVTRYEGGGISLFNVLIYPPVGGTIDGNPVNTAITISPGIQTYRLFVTTNSLDYRSYTSN